MDIDRCTSILELFAAFNFTYAVLSDSSQREIVIPQNNISDDSASQEDDASQKSIFVEIIDNRLLISFSKFINKGETLGRNLNNKLLTIRTILDRYPSNEYCIERRAAYANLEGLTTLWIKEVKDKKSEKRKLINTVFPFISFFLATFCITVLGISSGGANTKHTCLLVFLLMSTGIYIYILLLKDRNDYFKLSKRIGIVIGLTIIFQLVLYFIYDGMTGKDIERTDYIILTFMDRNLIAKTVVVFATITFPFLHFIIYFFKINNANKEIENKSEQSIVSYERMYNKYDTEDRDKLNEFDLSDDIKIEG